ncbi:MAG: trypsin-like peptidase domain-containing protein [Pirellulaceae bacterium]
MTCAVTLVLFAALAAADDPVVLEFTTANCPACRKVEPVVRGLATQGFPIRQIDGRAQPELVRQFKIKGYPTFVLVSAGREVSRIEGAASRERLIALLKPAAAAPQMSQQEMLVRGQSPEASRPAPSPIDATVRLHVQDLNGGGAGVGTGTIIDTHYNEEAKAEEALLVTCGHLFRDSQGKGKITVDLFVGGQVRQVEGQLLDFDDKRDIALVTIWPGVKVAPVQVAPKNFVSRPQDRVFTIGCSEGREPTVQESRVNAINRFSGRPNITVAGAPVNGRSGGGLFSAEGLLIGVCNASIDDDNEGLYASLPAIHGQLDKFNLQAIYERAASPIALTSATTPEPVQQNEIPVRPASSSLEAAEQNPASAPELPRRMPRTAPLMDENIAGAGDEMEVVVIVRSKRSPENQSEIYVVDSVSPELLSRITTAARQSAQARSASRQTQFADRLARQNRANDQPVVRGQLR